MPVKYIPYVPDTIEGQAILDNITRTRRVLRYRDNGAVRDHIRRGLPLYETAEMETVGAADGAGNLLLRGECLSACAYLKNEGVALDLVYIDPPFASGADYAKNVYLRRNPHKAQQIAQTEEELEIEELRAFEEKMYGDIWNKEDYLNWMFENLTAIKAVMSETASIYVHIGVHIGAYVKVLMDEVFGESNFRNEIVVRRTKKNIRENEYVKTLNSATDSIFFYAMSEDVGILPPTKPAPKEDRWHAFDAPGLRTGMDYDLFGVKPPTGRHWMRSENIATAWIKEGKLRPSVNTGRPEYRVDATEHEVCDSLWDDVSTYSFNNDYATEKSETLLQRIVKASSSKGMIVADFFGGSGVTAKVAHDLERRFVHVDVGVNSLQTVRDRLKAAGAGFRALDIQDGVSLFRNPIQTMDKLKTLITGLKNEDGLDSFWEGAIQDANLGLMPVYLPNLLDHQTKVLDVPLISRVLHEALPDLPNDVKRAIVYYVDIDDRPKVEKFIKDHNMTGVEIELRDLKEILDEVTLNDEAQTRLTTTPDGYEVEILRFASDRLHSKINAYNQKKTLNGKAHSAQTDTDDGNDEDNDAEPGSGNGANRGKTAFKPIQISDNGLELIEWLSLDCTNAEGAWRSDAEIKIDAKGFVAREGKKTKTFWDAKITSPQKPLRLKIRNIAGDESVLSLT